MSSGEPPAELPSPADRRTLVQRAHLTLTGLPAPYQEVQRWQTDPRPDLLSHLTD